jgi:hypothetical protein
MGPRNESPLGGSSLYSLVSHRLAVFQGSTAKIE